MTLQSKMDTIHSNVPKVHQAGKDYQLKAMWDYYQQGGERVDYDSAFTGYMWDSKSFKPIYNIQPSRANMMFFWAGLPWQESDRLLEPLDLVEQLSECGVTLDFSKCTEMWRAFSRAHISHVGTIDFAACKAAWSSYDCANDKYYDDGLEHEQLPQHWAGLFYGSAITTIDKLIFSHLNPSFDSRWLPYKLVNVTCEGTIVNGGLDFTYCEDITRESIMQFFNVLADFNSEQWQNLKKEDNCYVTLGETNAAKLTDADKAVATNKGWILL